MTSTSSTSTSPSSSTAATAATAANGGPDGGGGGGEGFIGRLSRRNLMMKATGGGEGGGGGRSRSHRHNHGGLGEKLASIKEKSLRLVFNNDDNGGDIIGRSEHDSDYALELDDGVNNNSSSSSSDHEQLHGSSLNGRRLFMTEYKKFDSSKKSQYLQSSFAASIRMIVQNDDEEMKEEEEEEGGGVADGKSKMTLNDKAPAEENTTTTKVSFSVVQLREYPIIVGDNPGGRAGCPITIDWVWLDPLSSSPSSSSVPVAAASASASSKPEEDCDRDDEEPTSKNNNSNTTTNKEDTKQQHRQQQQSKQHLEIPLDKYESVRSKHRRTKSEQLRMTKVHRDDLLKSLGFSLQERQLATKNAVLARKQRHKTNLQEKYDRRYERLENLSTGVKHIFHHIPYGGGHHHRHHHHRHDKTTTATTTTATTTSAINPQHHPHKLKSILKKKQ